MLPDFRVRQRDYLLEIAQALTQELDLDNLLNRILDISLDLLSGQAGLIALRSERGRWHIQSSRNLQPAFLRYLEQSLTNLPEFGDPAVQEIPEINRILTDVTRTVSGGLFNGVGLPLATRQRVMGVIFIFRGYSGLFSANDRLLLGSFASQAAIAVQNAQLYSIVSRENQRLDALLNSAADGILILENDLQIERCNPALLRMLNTSEDAVLGQFHDKVIRWAKPPQGLTLEDAAANGWPLTDNAALYVEGDLQRDSSLPSLPVGITYAPLLGEDGTLGNIIATLRDITRFRQAEEVKSTFVSIVSHELKTPVALIKGYVSTLRRQDAEWDKAILEEGLEVIEEEADRLSLMIENLLDASRLQAGGITLKRADISLPDLSRRLAERFQTQAEGRIIRVDFPADFPVVLADEARIEQVLNNLLTNSLKYAPTGEITISGQTRPDTVILCVSDQGPGIAPEDIPHVFDRFYRAPEMVKNTKGAGLGLYLCRSIIEAHGGRIWVDGGTAPGARICFSLPRSE